MNILFCDTEKCDIEEVYFISQKLKEKLGDELIVLPKDFSLIQNCSKDQLLMIRDSIDKELDKIGTN